MLQAAYREESVSDDAGTGVARVASFLEGAEQLGFEDTPLFVKQLDGVLACGVARLALSHDDIEPSISFHINYQRHGLSDLHEAVGWLCEGSTSNLFRKTEEFRYKNLN